MIKIVPMLFLNMNGGRNNTVIAMYLKSVTEEWIFARNTCFLPLSCVPDRTLPSLISRTAIENIQINQNIYYIIYKCQRLDIPGLSFSIF